MAVLPAAGADGIPRPARRRTRCCGASAASGNQLASELLRWGGHLGHGLFGLSVHVLHAWPGLTRRRLGRGDVLAGAVVLQLARQELLGRLAEEQVDVTLRRGGSVR